MTDPWASADPLGEALHFLRMSGVFCCRSQCSAPWGLALPPLAGCLMFHVVTAGQCWIDAGGVPPRLLRAGDVALVPHGEGHDLSSGAGVPRAPLFDLPRRLVSERYEILEHGGGGEPVTLICGAVRFDHPAAHHLVTLLPRLLAIEAWSSPHMDAMQTTVRLLADEARELRPGGETVITRLADILVIQILRSWLAQDPAARTGWLLALQDPRIGRAIARIHRDPARAWTLPALAAESAMSRSAFAARFTALVGEPAMHYAARWRMYLALTWLRDDQAGVAEVADRLGYQSEAAFSRAFKRVLGLPPGAARRAPSAPTFSAMLPASWPGPPPVPPAPSSS